MIRRAQPWLGTLVEISVAEQETSGDNRIGVAINAAFAAIAHVHRRMSFHENGSDVSAINRLAAGQRLEVDATTAKVLRCALMLEAASGGLFSLACGQRLAAWGYLPAPDVQAAHADNGIAASNTSAMTPSIQPLPLAVIEIDADRLVTRSGAGWIDLGGIAKGHAVDCAVAALQSHGITAACVNAGGDLRAFGAHAFAVTVRDPRNPTQVGRDLALQEQALATSACYFSRRDIDGVSHSALIDGTTGQPVVVNTSASVLAPNCMLADGLTKIVIATGDARHPLLERFNASAFII